MPLGCRTMTRRARATSLARGARARRTSTRRNNGASCGANNTAIADTASRQLVARTPKRRRPRWWWRERGHGDRLALAALVTPTRVAPSAANKSAIASSATTKQRLLHLQSQRGQHERQEKRVPLAGSKRGRAARDLARVVAARAMATLEQRALFSLRENRAATTMLSLLGHALNSLAISCVDRGGAAREQAVCDRIVVSRVTRPRSFAACQPELC